MLSKLSWHLTVADLSKTWVVQTLDNIVTKYIRQWLDLSISAALSTLVLKKCRYGINLILPSAKFTQCQTVIRIALKTSPNLDINAMQAATSNSSNIQYDQYKNIKKVLTAIQKDHEGRINHELASQGFIMSSILKLSSSKTRWLWSTVQQNMHINIFNFMTKYLNNTLPNLKNLYKWSLSDSPFARCVSILKRFSTLFREAGRYTWHHNSVLLFIASSLSSLQRCRLYFDFPSFLSPLLITSESLRPDLTLISPENTLYILELMVGFETNIELNSKRKAMKYDRLLQDLRSQYRAINFINPSMNALGIYDASSDMILTMMKDLGIKNSVRQSITKKIMNIAVRSTYYIFCRRNST